MAEHEGKAELRDLLEQRGWQQKRLAKECGVQPCTVSRWLSGERQPAKRHIRKLRELLGIAPAAWV